MDLYDLGFNGVTTHPRTKVANRPWKGYSRFYDSDRVLQEAGRQREETLYRWLYDDFSEPGSCDFFLFAGWTPEARVVVVDGDDSMAMAVIEERCDPTPMMQRTRMGLHYLFRHPGEDVYVKTTSKVVIDGERFAIDIRGDGGGIVAPGSIHQSGFTYDWVEPWTKDMLHSLPVYDPAWLPTVKATTVGGFDFDFETEIDSYEDLLDREDLPPVATRVERARQYLKKCPGTTQGDNASDACLRVASKVVIGFAVPPEEALELISDEWAGRDDQKDSAGGYYPWTDAEIGHKIQAAISSMASYPGEPGDKVRDDRYEFEKAAEEVDRLVQGWEPVNLTEVEVVETTTPAIDPYRDDLTKAGVVVASNKVVKGALNYFVECPCCGLVGAFWRRLEDHRTGYECSAGRKTWTEGKALWRAAQSPKVRKRRAYTLDELDSLPSPGWLVEGHIAERSLTLIYGASNVGKSFYVIDLGMSIATGRSFFGRHQVQQGPVVYVVGEGIGGIKKRVKAWRKHHANGGEVPFYVIPYPFGLTSGEEEVSELVEVIRDKLGDGVSPALIILDTLSRHFGVGDENATRDMKSFTDACDRLVQDTGGGVAVVHHTGKDTTRKERGNVTLRSNSDTVIYVDSYRGREGMEIECQKMKDAEFFDSYKLLRNVVDVDGDTSLVYQLASETDKPSMNTEPNWNNELEMVLHYAPIGEGAAQTKSQIVEAVQSGMVVSQMSPIGKNKCRILIGSLIANGSLITVPNPNGNTNHDRFFKLKSTAKDADFFS